MTLASGASVSLSYVAETTRGTTPGSPTMKTLRSTGRNINARRPTFRSAEQRADRGIADLRMGMRSGDGGIPFEMAPRAHDDMIESALAGSWGASVTTGSTSLSATASGYARAAGSFITDGFDVGDEIGATGFTAGNNNGRSKITALTATSMTVAKNPATTVEAAAAGRTLTMEGRKVKRGTTLKTFTMERRFADITQYQQFRGVAHNRLDLTIAPDRIVGGTQGLIAMDGSSLSGTSLGAPTAAPADSPYDIFTGACYEGGSMIAVVTGLTFAIANNRSLQGVVGSYFSPDVFEGEADISGTLSVFLEDATLYNKFYNETESSIDVLLNPAGGTADFYRFRFPRVKYATGDIDPPQRGPIVLSMNFQALVDSVSATDMIAQRGYVS